MSRQWLTNPESTFEDYMHITLPCHEQESVVDLKGSVPELKNNNSRLALITLLLCLAAITMPLYRVRRVPLLY